MNKISTTKKITEPTNTKMSKQFDFESKFPFEPGSNVINNILNYSKALSIRKSKVMEKFEIVLN